MRTHKIIGVGVMALTLASSAVAQTTGNSAVHDMRRLGGATSFYHPPLTDTASLKKMATTPAVASDIRTVMGLAGLPELSDKVLATLSGVDRAVMGGACSDATPQDGTVVDCAVRPGDTLQWMAYRPRTSKGPGFLQSMRWAGTAPFRAFLFRVTSNDRIYTFIIPKACGNISLMNTIDVPRAVVAAPPPPAPRAPAPPPPPAPAPPPPPAPRPAEVAVAAPAPPPMAQAAAVSSPFFIDALFGKDRRTRPIENTNLEFSQCSPLLGFKFGVAKRFKNDWELAGAAGLAFSLVNDEDKVTEHEFFVDVEANKYLDNGVFLGTGLSLWDLNHSDTWTPAWMIHAGVPLSKGTKVKTYFLVEGRLFMDHIDDIQNNYQFWGGVRLHF
jgi:hypothetical protein